MILVRENSEVAMIYPDLSLSFLVRIVMPWVNPTDPMALANMSRMDWASSNFSWKCRNLAECAHLSHLSFEYMSIVYIIIYIHRHTVICNICIYVYTYIL